MPATVPHPADYPVGSLESRAAARARVDQFDRAQGVFRIIFCGLGSPTEEPRIGRCPQPRPDGLVVEVVHVPVGWTQEQWEQFLAQQPIEKQREWEAFLTRWSG